MSKEKPPGDDTIKGHPGFLQGVTDSYVGRMKVTAAELKKAAEAAPEVSQGPWRERAYQARAVMSRQEIQEGLAGALRAALGTANHPRVAFDAVRPAWMPILRQALEQGGGDGIDVWLYGLFSPPGRAPRQVLFVSLADGLGRLRNALELVAFETEAQALIQLVDRELSAAAPVKLSFKEMEKELEGKLEVDEILAIRAAVDDDISRRLSEIDAAMVKLRDEVRAQPGKQAGGIYSNFVRLKYELKLLDLELKRRKGTLKPRSSL